MKPVLLFLMFIFTGEALMAQYNFENATEMDAGDAKGGMVKPGDQDRFYKTLLPANGTVKVYLAGTNNGDYTNNAFVCKAYDKSRRQLALKEIGGSLIEPGESVRDTLEITSRTADSIYLVINKGTGSRNSYAYTLSYEMTDEPANDPEPNDTYEQALEIEENSAAKGNIGYIADGITDRNDYYKTLLPANGTVKIYLEGTHTGGPNSTFTFLAYDKSRRQLALTSLGENQVTKRGDTVRDTVEITSRAADSLYLLVSQGNEASFDYTIRYEVTDTSVDDPEPNGTFEQALEIEENSAAKGNIGHIADNVRDNNDYYKTLLPVNGTVKIYFEGTHTGGTYGAFSFNAYDKSRRLLKQGSIGDFQKTKRGDTVRDTVEITSRAADSLYLVVSQANNASFVYTMRYEVTDTSVNDPEPNGTFAQAVAVQLADTVKGLIGYVADNVYDGYDYYSTALPAYGNLSIFADARNTGSNKASFAVYVYDKNRRQIGYKSATAVAGAGLKDTLTLNCIKTDSIYVLVYQYESGRSLAYNLSFAFDAQQPQAKMAYTKAGGTYEFVNQSDFASKYMWKMGNDEAYNTEAPPLITYKPGGYDVQLIAENEECSLKDTALLSLVVNGLDRYTPDSGGTGNIVFTAYGGGFHEGMSIQLKQGSEVYKDSVAVVNEKGSVFSALVNMHNAKPGAYDVSIITNDTTYNYPGGFVCEEAIYKLSGEIIGRNIIRANRDNSYKVRIYNEGNVMAGHTEVYLLTPNNLEVILLDSLLDLKFETVDADTLPDVVQVTKAEGYPIDGKVRAYLMAGIPAGGYRDLRFNVNGTVGTDKIYLWVKGPYSGSPYTKNGADCLEATLKTVGGLLWDGLSLLPVVDCAAGTLKGIASSLYSSVSYFAGWSDKYSTAASLYKSFAGTAKDCAGEIAAATGIATAVSPAIEIADIVTDVATLSYNLSVNVNEVLTDCVELEDKKEKKVEVRNSFDPNAKSGPSGFGAAQYINGINRRLSYTIFFENMASATLPAQEVIILDTLDTNVYDLSTFRADSYGWADSAYNLPIGASDFLQDIPLNNELAVRFYIALNTQTGVIKATFKTIDRATGTITEDPLAGFLPPNINAPEGEGFVSFSIDMKPGLADGTVIANTASIVFDGNAPIVTDVWSNTIDRNLPSSRITGAYQLTDSSMVVKVKGSDPASGIGKYKLYFSEEGTPYTYLGKMKDSVIVKGTLGKTYDFYVQAVDEVGNLESKNSQAEATVKLTPTEVEAASKGTLMLYPIPSNGTVNVELNVPEMQQLQITVYSASGQRVAELYNGTTNGPLKISRTLHQLSSGVYFVQATGSKGLNLKNKLVLVK